MVPHFPSSEEEEKVVESNATDVTVSKRKGKDVNQTEVFALQKTINGTPDRMLFVTFSNNIPLFG